MTMISLSPELRLINTICIICKASLPCATHHYLIIEQQICILSVDGVAGPFFEQVDGALGGSKSIDPIRDTLSQQSHRVISVT